MAKTETVREGKMRSYRWYPPDRDLIDRLRMHFSGPTGEACREIDVMRAALICLAEREGLLNKKVNKK